jgi:hypothetical protein
LAAKFSVGDWTVFPDLNTLERHGQSVRLQPKVMHVLVAWPTPPAKRSRKNRFLPVSGRELLVSDDAPFVHSRVFQRSGVILCVAIEVLQCRTVGQGNHRRSRFRSARVPSSTSLGRRCDRRRGPLRYPAMSKPTNAPAVSMDLRCSRESGRQRILQCNSFLQFVNNVHRAEELL